VVDEKGFKRMTTIHISMSGLGAPRKYTRCASQARYLRQARLASPLRLTRSIKIPYKSDQDLDRTFEFSFSQ